MSETSEWVLDTYGAGFLIPTISALVTVAREVEALEAENARLREAAHAMVVYWKRFATDDTPRPVRMLEAALKGGER